MLISIFNILHRTNTTGLFAGGVRENKTDATRRQIHSINRLQQRWVVSPSMHVGNGRQGESVKYIDINQTYKF
ncbi:MAG: hypothetical protein ABJB11_24940 [Ferruginibacter sp.]